VGRHPENPKAVLWNPADASFEESWKLLGVQGGTLAVIGGTEIFGLFLDIGYDAFHLTRADHVRLPGGRPVFPQVPASTPEEVLRERGYKPGQARLLDAEKNVRLVTWIPS
jgi:dihydrofolate reductase